MPIRYEIRPITFNYLLNLVDMRDRSQENAINIPLHPRVLLIDYPSITPYVDDPDVADITRLKKAAQSLIDEGVGIATTRRKTLRSFTSGLLTIGAYLRKYGFEVAYTSVLNDLDEASILKIDQADVLLMTAMTPIYPYVRQIARQIKARSPEKLIIVGGYHVSALAVEVLREEQAFDVVVIGEGEIPILKLLLQPALRGGILGTAVRDRSHTVLASAGTPLAATEIPTPDYTLLPGDPSGYRYNIQTVRGCPKRCGYCVNGFFWQNVRRRPTGSVIDEMRAIEAILGPRAEIHITDNILTVNSNWLRDLTEAYERSGLSLQFTADVKAEFIDRECVELMRRLGVKKVCMGFEDASDAVRHAVHRQGTLAENIRAIDCIRRHSDILVEGYWMLGLPGFNSDLIQQNINTAVDLLRSGRLHTICSDILFVPLPGSPLFHEAARYGITLLHRNWEHYHRSHYLPVYKLDTATQEQLRRYFISFERAITEAYLDKLGLGSSAVLEKYDQLVESAMTAT